MNTKLLLQVADKINSKNYNQSAFTCNYYNASDELCRTTFCIAGHAVLLHYKSAKIIGASLYIKGRSRRWYEAAARALRLKELEANFLFNGHLIFYLDEMDSWRKNESDVALVKRYLRDIAKNPKLLTEHAEKRATLLD